MRVTTPDLLLTAAAHLRPRHVFVDPGTEARHTARGVLLDSGRVRVRTTTGAVLWLDEHYLIEVEEPPK